MCRAADVQEAGRDLQVNFKKEFKFDVGNFELPADEERFWSRTAELIKDFPRGIRMIEAMLCFQRAADLKTFSVRSINTVLAVHSGCMGMARDNRVEEFIFACREAFIVLVEHLCLKSDHERNIVTALLRVLFGEQANYLEFCKSIPHEALVERVFFADR